MRPFSQAAGVQCRGYSLGLQRALTDFGAEESFAKACQRVHEHYGIEVGAAGVRHQTLRHAEAMAFELETEVRLPKGGVAQLLAETDGSMIPVVEIKAGRGDKRKQRECLWREARLSLAGQVNQQRRRYRATLGDVGQAGRQWRATVVEAGGGQNTRLHCVGDGAAWIIKQVRAQFGGQASYLLDFYHVSEYLAGASQRVEARNSQQWLRQAQARLKGNDVAWVLGELRAHQEAREVAEAEAPVRRCLRYLEARLEHLDYAGAIARGWPIGSGEIESGHRSVLQKRLKIAGAWWLAASAEKMLALRTTRANQEWESYWKMQRQAQA